MRKIGNIANTIFLLATLVALWLEPHAVWTAGGLLGRGRAKPPPAQRPIESGAGTGKVIPGGSV